MPFIFGKDPSTSSSTSTTPRAIVSAFGDGYEQRAPDGIHASRLVATLVWNDLSNADADVVEAECLRSAGVVSDTYALPNETGNDRLWVVEEWQRVYKKPLTSDITAKLREVFDL